MMTENEAARIVVDAAYQIHSCLGPGLLESTYQSIMVYELRKRGLRVEAEVSIPIYYDGQIFEPGFRADLLVENCLIVELKSIELLSFTHKKQLLTYLRLSDKRLGLLINFGAKLIKEGIHRIANRMPQ